MPNEPECADMASNRRYMSGSGAQLPASIRRAYLAACLTVAGLAVASTAWARGNIGDFDYYALSLSWSPTYCTSQVGQNDSQQCGPGRTYAFVVHGLWPQYERGWPENC